MSKTLLNPLLTPTLAAYAAGKAIAPLWVAPNGRAFYPLAGGAEDPDPDPDPEGGSKDPQSKFQAITSQEELDRVLAGRLQRERSKFADYEDLKAAKADLDKIREEAKSEQEKAVDAARTEGEKTAAEKANARVVRAEAKAMAAGAKFRDPADAVAFIDLTKVKVDENGDPDAKQLKELLEDLAKTKPYLVDDGKTRPIPDPSQGGGGKDTAGISRGEELWEARRGTKKKTS